MSLGIFLLLFFGLPIVAIFCFVKNLMAYRRVKSSNESEEEIKKKKIWMIISAVIAGILTVIVLGSVIMFYFAIAYM